MLSEAKTLARGHTGMGSRAEIPNDSEYSAPSPSSEMRGPPVILFCFFLNLFILFIYFWLHWVFVAARGLSLVAASGGYSSLWFAGFSLRWLLLLQSTGSRAQAQ